MKEKRRKREKGRESVQGNKRAREKRENEREGE